MPSYFVSERVDGPELGPLLEAQAVRAIRKRTGRHASRIAGVLWRSRGHATFTPLRGRKGTAVYVRIER